MNENSEQRRLNEERFQEEAKRVNASRPLLKRVLGKDKVGSIDIAQQEAEAWNEWREIESTEAQSPLNELLKTKKSPAYRPFIVDTPEAVENYVGNSERGFGFAFGYGMVKMFGGTPSPEMTQRMLGRLEWPEGMWGIEREKFNNLLIRLIESKIKELGNDHIRPLTILELASGRTYGDKDPNYGNPWLSRYAKIKFGDSVNVSITEALNDWTVNSESVVIAKKNGALDISDDVPLEGKSLTGVESLEPTKKFTPNSKDSNIEYFVRPRLDPVFEKMVFGINTYGNIDLHNIDSVKAFVGIQEEKFDIIFSKNSYEIVEPEQFKDLLSDKGIFVSGGLWKDHFYYPVTRIAQKKGEGMASPHSTKDQDVDSYLMENGILEKPELTVDEIERKRVGELFSTQMTAGISHDKVVIPPNPEYIPPAQRAEEFISQIKSGLNAGINTAKTELGL